MVRGQIIRRRIITKLRCLQSVAKTHSQVHLQSVGEGCKNGKRKEILTAKKDLVEKEIKVIEVVYSLVITPSTPY